MGRRDSGMEWLENRGFEMTNIYVGNLSYHMTDDQLRDAFAAHPGRIAAIIAEGAGANAGILAPEDGFNDFLVETAHREGALFILDEVLTGFRVDPAGWWGHERARGAGALRQ